MKVLKSAVAGMGAVAASLLGGTALASHGDNWPPPESMMPRYVVVPQQPAVVGRVTAPSPTYYYEPAPRYYYYEPRPTYYYYEPAQVASYYYYDDSPFPHSDSRD